MSTADKAFLYRNHLNKAYEFIEQADQHYNAGEYSNAIKHYHCCILYARAVAQLSSANLSKVFNSERDSELSGNLSFLRIPDNKIEMNKQKLNDDCFKTTLTKSTNSIKLTYFSDNQKCLRTDLTREEEIKQEARLLLAKCYCNLAVHIINGPPKKHDDYLRAVYYCDKILCLNEGDDNVKFLKACSFQKAELYDKAIEQFQKCTSSEVKLHIEQCNLKLTEKRKKLNAIVRANFDKAQQDELLQVMANGNELTRMNEHAINSNIQQ